MLYNNIVKTQGAAAALKTDYRGACCLQVHVGYVPAHMTATQAAIAQHKHVALGWPIEDGTSAYHCNLASEHSAEAAVGKVVPWHDTETGIIYDEGCLVS